MKNKYHVSRVGVPGQIIYDSRAEAKRHQELLLMEKANKIQALHYHGIKFYLGKSDKNKSIWYTPDFTFIQDGQLIAEEVKGYRVRDFPVRSALFKQQFPEWKLKVISV